jgi:SAM-dependent methyltransferase
MAQPRYISVITMTQSIYRKRACPLCGGEESTVEIYSPHPAEMQTLDELRPFWFGIDRANGFFTYHRCTGCKLLFNPVFFNESQLEELYSAMLPNMDLVPDSAIAATQRGYFATAQEQATVGGGYLEIGPDIGYIVGDAARSGRFDHLWLFEPNRMVHDRLRSAAGDCQTTIMPDMDSLSVVPDESIGLAVMVHVLDHLLDPVGMIAAIHSKLRPGGILLIVTHNERSLLSRVLGRRWPAFCLQHPQLYNPDTIRHLLARAGMPAAQVTPSRNYFPIDFLARQAAWTVGIRLTRVPLPRTEIGLRLGNIQALAIKDG